MTGQVVKHVCDAIKCYEDGEWCHVLLPPSGRGLVIIASSYGTWSYSWHHIGEQSIASFLLECDCEYLCRRFLSERAREFDLQATVDEIRRKILYMRRSGCLDKEDARDEWGLCDALRDYDISYEQWGGETRLPECYELRLTRIDSNWQHFWDRLWKPHVRPALRELQ